MTGIQQASTTDQECYGDKNSIRVNTLSPTHCPLGRNYYISLWTFLRVTSLLRRASKINFHVLLVIPACIVLEFSLRSAPMWSWRERECVLIEYAAQIHDFVRGHKGTTVNEFFIAISYFVLILNCMIWFKRFEGVIKIEEKL